MPWVLWEGISPWQAGGRARPGPFSICLINARLPSNTHREAGLQGAAHEGEGKESTP